MSNPNQKDYSPNQVDSSNQKAFSPNQVDSLLLTQIDSLFITQIDSLFQNQIPNNNLSLIKDLESFKVNDLIPFTQIIKEKVISISLDYELYFIKLERLTKEMNKIEKENTKLENEILYQTSIYNRLKDLLIHLEIKESHFISLETDNLKSSEGVSRIEKALYALGNFKEENYKIRVVKEKKERIEKSLKEFYKRFIKEINLILKEEKVKGELNLHKNLYNQLNFLKEIFLNSKKFKDFHAVLCGIYAKHCCLLYCKEIENHLNKINRILNENKDRDNLDKILEGLLESYKNIIKIEKKFMESLGIIKGEGGEEGGKEDEEYKGGVKEGGNLKEDPRKNKVKEEDAFKEYTEKEGNLNSDKGNLKDNNLKEDECNPNVTPTPTPSTNFNYLESIFIPVNKLILRFFYDIFYLSELRTINFLEIYVNNQNQNINNNDINHYDTNIFFLLLEDLKVLLGGLKKKFIQKELEIKDKEEGIQRFKEILKKSKLKDVNGILYNFNREKIMKNEDQNENNENGLFKNLNLIKNLYLIFNDQNRKNEFENDLKEIKEKIKKKVIEEVYKNENWEENLKKLIKNLKKEEKEEIYEILKGIEKDEEKLRGVVN